MYTGFKHLHSYSAYLTLLFLIIAVAIAVFGLLQKSSFTKGNKTIALLALIGAHFQMLLGIVLYFVSPLGFSNVNGAMMKNADARLYGMEHPLMMLIAIILITIGYSQSKKADNSQLKFKKIAIYYGIGLVFILSRIPWNAWWS